MARLLPNPPAQLVTTPAGSRIHTARELETGLLMTDCDRVLDAVGSFHDIGPTCADCIRWQHDAGDHDESQDGYQSRCRVCRSLWA